MIYKIIDQKYLKGLINQDVCNKLIKFYEDKQNIWLRKSYKYPEDKKKDNCTFKYI